MRCIFCLKTDGPFSVEHIFPDALGGRVTLPEVCKPCNDRLGHSVDKHLTDHWFIQWERRRFNLRDNQGRLPNPVEDGCLVEEPDQKVRFLLDDPERSGRVYRHPKVHPLEERDGKTWLSVQVDAMDEKKLPKIVNTKLKRAGLPTMTPEQIAAASVRQSLPPRTLHMEGTMDLLEYKRAILKIAYELAYRWLGDEYLSDPMAAVLREAIFAPVEKWGKRSLVQGTIDFVVGKPKCPLWNDGRGAHVAYLMPLRSSLGAYVRIFDRIEGTVLLSHKASAYPWFRGMALWNHPVTGRVVEVDIPAEEPESSPLMNRHERRAALHRARRVS